MKTFATIATALLLTTGMGMAQTPSGNDTPTNRGAQPVQPGNQSGSTGQQDTGPAMNDNTGMTRPAPADRKPTDGQTSGGAQPVKPGAPGTK
jgi:hypothetical protein